MKPKVSIIYPSIRKDKYAHIAEQSILRQTLRSIQVIKDSKSRECNADSLNCCLDRVQGDYVTFAYDDDICMLDKTMVLTLYADAFPEYDVFYSSQLMIDEKGRLGGYLNVPDFDMDKFIYFGNFISTATCLVRKSAIGDIRFNRDFPITHEYLFFYELAKKGCQFRRIDVPLAMIRVHKNQMSVLNHDMKLEEHKRLREYLNDTRVYSNRKYSESYKRMAGIA